MEKQDKKNKDFQLLEFGESNPFINSLIPLLDAHGWRGNLRELHDALPVDLAHMDLGHFLNTVANLNFEHKTLSLKLKDIDTRFFPCLFITNDDDCYVLIKKSNEEIFCYDGKFGRYSTINYRSTKGKAFFFSLMTSKKASLLHPQDGWFYDLITRFKRLFFLAIILSFFLSVLALISPLFIMTIFQQMNLEDNYKTLFYLSLGLCIYLSSHLIFHFLRSRIMSYISIRTGNLVTNQVVRRLLYLPAQYSVKATIASQVSRVKDFESVREFFAGPAFVTLLELPFVFLLIVGLFILSGHVAWIPIGVMVLFVIFGYGITSFIRNAAKEYASINKEKHEFILEMLTNFKTIRMGGVTDLWVEKYRELSANSALSSARTAKLNSIVNSVSQGFVTIAGLATMMVATLHVMEGGISAGALMASMLMVWRILAPLRSGFSVSTQLINIKRSISQLDRLMKIPLESNVDKNLVLTRNITGKVMVANVTMRYSPDTPPVLYNINFHANSGELVVLGGRLGSGKSTLIKILLGLYTPQIGQIILDDTNIKQLDPLQLRRAIAYLPQNSTLFSGSIGYNLLMGNPEATEDQIEEALRDSFLDEDIKKLPNGLETMIDKIGGEIVTESFRQRIGLARLFVMSSNLHILDHPDYHLEPFQQEGIIEKLSRMKGKSTILVATENEKIMELADKILWMDKGRMKEFSSVEGVQRALRKAA